MNEELSTISSSISSILINTTYRTNSQSYNMFNRFSCNLNNHRYSIQRELINLLAPIFKIKKWEPRYNTLVLPDSTGLRNTLPNALQNITLPTVADQKIIDISTILTNDMNTAINIMHEVEDNYTEVTNPAIEAIYKSAFAGTSELDLDTAAQDMAKLKIYKHKTQNVLIIISNYLLQRNYRNNNGLKYQQEMSDINSHITFGLLPVLIPEFRNDLNSLELEVFKRYSNPVKLFSDKETITVFLQLLQSPEYIEAIKNYKINAMKEIFKEQQGNTYQRKIEQTRQTIKSFTDQILDLERDLINSQRDYMYFKYSEQESDSWAEYLLKHPYIYNTDVSNDRIRITLRLPLQQWEPDEAEILYKNLEHNEHVPSQHLVQIQKFMKNILLDQIGKYYMTGLISFSISDFSYQMLKIQNNWNMSDYGYSDFLTTLKAGLNPHLEHFGCIGTYQARIAEAQRKKDFIGMLESMLAPYKNWNLGDGAVSSKMYGIYLPYLIEHNIPCIEFKGEIYSITKFNQLVDDMNKPKEEPKPVTKKRAPRKKKVDEDTVTLTIDQNRTLNVNFNETIAQDIEQAIDELRTQAVDINDLQGALGIAEDPTGDFPDPEATEGVDL